ncbi:MAG: hypothetical protein WC449_05505 [Candidatus Paceibacterota bacterium]
MKNKLAVLLVILWLATFGLIAATPPGFSLWKVASGVVSLVDATWSVSIPGGISGNLVTISDPDITGHHSHTIVDEAGDWTFNTSVKTSGSFIMANGEYWSNATDTRILGTATNIDMTGTGGYTVNKGGADGDMTLLVADLGTDATLTWDNTNSKFVFNYPVGIMRKVTSTTAATLTTGQIRHGIILATAAGTYILPAVDASIVGSYFMIVSTTAAAVVVDPNASDRIVLSGTALDDGDKIQNDSSSGSCIIMFVDSVNGYYAYPLAGVWFDAGA